MADSLFGPSPAQILYARQKDLADRQAEDYRTYLATAQTPAERTSIMAGRTLTQGFAPLLGLGAGAQDPMLQQASMTQNIISKYGADALTNPDTLDQMAAEFKASGMNNEAFQLAARAADIRKNKPKDPDKFITASGKDLMEKFPELFSGLDEFAGYQVNTTTNEVKDLGSGLTIGTVPPGSRLRRTEDGLVVEKIPSTEEEEIAFTIAVDSAKQAALALGNVRKAKEIIKDNKYIRFGNGFATKFFDPNSFVGKIIPTEVGNLYATIQSLQSEIALGALRRLKEVSPSGASGLGAVNQREWAALENNIRSLDIRKLTVSQLYENLEKIERDFETAINKIKNDPDLERRKRGLKFLEEAGLLDQVFLEGENNSTASSTTQPTIDIGLDFGGPGG
jgi:hypothetical protein